MKKTYVGVKPFDYRQKLLGNVEMEYRLFQAEMLQKTGKEIYEACSKIYFYSSIYEFFLYNMGLKEEVVCAAYMENFLIYKLWGIYTKYENLRVDTWDGIDELLNVYLIMQEKIYADSEVSA